MKKLLLASTALVATAGMAAAEVSPNITLTGYAEIGIIGGDARTTEQFHHDMDMNITFEAETDRGLVFGADIDLDEVSNGISNTSGPHIVYVKGSFGNITMGDTDGALDFAMTEVDALTTIDDAHTVHLGFSGNGAADTLYDGQVLRYDYSFEQFSVAASLEIDDSGNSGDPLWGIGAKGSFDIGNTEFLVGAGYQGASYTQNNGNQLDFSIWGVSAGFDVSGFEIALNYSDATEAPVNDLVITDGDNFDLDLSAYTGTPADYSHWGIGVAYNWQAWGFHANYGEYKFTNINSVSGAEAKSTGYGLAVMYEIGEGISASAGYGNSDLEVDGEKANTDLWSLGLVMNF